MDLELNAERGAHEMSERTNISRQIASNPFYSGVFAPVRADMFVIRGQVCPSVCFEVPAA